MYLDKHNFIICRYSKRGKLQDKLVLNQGIRFVQPSPTATVKLPSAVEKPVQLPTGKTDAHQFHSPPDTAGTVKLKQRKTISATVEPSTSLIIPPSTPVVLPRVVLAPAPEVVPAQQLQF